MSLNRSLRTTALTLALACLPLAACATAPSAPPAAEARQATTIPFTAATVERLADGSGYQVSWQAPGAGNVRVYAGTAAEGTITGQAVAQGAATGGATVTGLPSSPRQYFTLVPDHGAPLVVADRGLHIATVPNLRDIGGYRTTDGRWVRMGMIYRADQFDRLTDADLATLDTLDPAVVIDLRTQSERTREPDRLPSRARGLVLDVAADSNGSLGGDMRQAMAAIASGKGADMLTSANRDFVSLPSARTAYTTMMHNLAKGEDGAVIYHCTAGKDRTGWATAVILTLLGVPRETVMADYMLSNTYLRAKNEKAMEMFKASGAPFDVSFLEPVMTVRPAFLQAAFDEVEQRYGSFDAYARDALGMTPQDIAALRDRYLAGSAQ